MSSLCNCRCDYCFYAPIAEGRKNLPERMSDRVAKALVSRAVAEADGDLTFAFQGGEPTLAGVDFFRRFLALEKSENQKRRSPLSIRHTIQTNGLLLNDEWAEFFARENFLVGISLDGTAPIHDRHRKRPGGEGSYAGVCSAVEILRRRRVPYNILCVITDEAAQAPGEIYGSLREHRYLQFIPCLPTGEGESFAPTAAHYAAFLRETFSLYERDLLAGEPTRVRIFDNFLSILLGGEPENCAMRGVCSQNPVIEADGSVYPCDFYSSDADRLGNILTSSFADLLSSDRAKAFLRASAQIPEKCRACRWFALCRGGCRRERTAGEYRFCEAYRAFFEENYPRLALLARSLRGK